MCPEAHTVGRDNSYGMLIIWTENERTFFIYDNLKKKFFETADLDAVLRELDTLPRDITIHRITKCQAGFSPEMPEKARKQIMEILNKGNRETESPFICCTCEGGEIVFPRFIN